MENKCFICNLTSKIIVHQENGYQSLKCPGCGLLFCNPLPEESHVDLTDHHVDSFYKLASKYKAQWLISKIGNQKTLLEVGAGDGHLLNEISKLGNEVYGLEPNIKRAQNIRNEYKLEAIEGLIEDCNLEKKYDAVFHVDLLAHFPDPYLALQKMKDLLVKDGYLCLEVGVMAGISPLWYKLFPLGLPQHRWLYSEVSLNKLFKAANLQVIHKTSHSLAPYVILKKVSGLILISILSRSLRPLVGRKVFQLHVLHQRISNFLRYTVGRYFPKVGPLTILYVTKPV